MEKLTVKFRKLLASAVIPARGSEAAAGYDLTCTSVDFVDESHVRYGTGIAVEIPPGYAGFVFPRSSVYKKNIQLANSVGVIDSDYRGEITFVYHYTTNYVHGYRIGERIGQLIILPVPEIDFVESEELSDTKRGVGGYGSTGN